MTGKASHRGKALQKDRYEQLKSAGMCVTCGKQKATESSIRCSDCLRRKKVSDNRAKLRKANSKLRQQINLPNFG